MEVNDSNSGFFIWKIALSVSGAVSVFFLTKLYESFQSLKSAFYRSEKTIISKEAAQEKQIIQLNNIINQNAADILECSNKINRLESLLIETQRLANNLSELYLDDKKKDKNLTD